MKKYIIESKVTRIEQVEVKAKNRREAMNLADRNKNLKWEQTHPEERQLISIS